MEKVKISDCISYNYSITHFLTQEREKFRPFCYECLHIDIFEYKRNVIDKYGETFIDLTDAPIVEPSKISSLTSLAVHYESAKMYKVLKLGSNILDNESQLGTDFTYLFSASTHAMNLLVGYIKIALFIVPEDMDEYNSIKQYQRLSLYDLYPASKYPQYSHLFMDFDYDPCKAHGTLSLPGNFCSPYISLFSALSHSLYLFIERSYLW